MAASPLTEVADGVRLAVRLTPKAARDRIDGVAAQADGGVVLKVGVTAVPENGKANAALIKLLARLWKLPKSTLTITAGHTDRRKTVHIGGEAPALRRHIEDWIASNG